MWAYKNSKCQYYGRYCYIDNKKIHFPLNAHYFNSWAKAIEKSDSIIIELKLLYLVTEVLQAIYYKQESNKKNKTKSSDIFNNLIYYSTY